METPSTAYFGQQVVQEMGKHLLAPAWSVPQKPAFACQILAAEGHESGLAGQISVRTAYRWNLQTLYEGRCDMRQGAIWIWLRDLALAFVVLTMLSAPATADQPTALRWSVEVSTAPHLPQDVWFAGMGNNSRGWQGGGSICLNSLTQGFQGGEQATLLLDVVEGGIFGVDGSPVPAETYTFPGIELPDFDYTVNDHTYYVILDAYVVQSKLPAFAVGDTVRFMYMWDDASGRTNRHMVLWADFGSGFFPFLSEGVMMANVRLHP